MHVVLRTATGQRITFAVFGRTLRKIEDRFEKSLNAEILDVSTPFKATTNNKAGTSPPHLNVKMSTTVSKTTSTTSTTKLVHDYGHHCLVPLALP